MKSRIINLNSSMQTRDFKSSKEKKRMNLHSAKKMSRRSFLKLSATAVAVAAVSDMLRGKPATSFVKSVSAAGEEVIKYGNCAGCQQGDCQTIYKMLDGVVVKVEGDPESPISQ